MTQEKSIEKAERCVNGSSATSARRRPRKTGRFPIVGMGASADEAEAVLRFFRSTPSDSGMAFVLVQRPARDPVSALAKRIAKETTMPVRGAQDGMPVEADHVYVVPPDAAATIENGILYLTPLEAPRLRRTPIDSFFRELARDQGEYSVGLVLVGLATDGSLGLRAIKERGGVTAALKPEAADCDTASGSALTTDLVDFAETAEDLPGRLREYARRLRRFKRQRGAHDLDENPARHIAAIHSCLREKAGHDFRGYKESTLVRRVESRMHVLRLNKVSDYVDRLRADSEEAAVLFKNLLIGVTQFFRDPEAFQELERSVIRPLVREQTPGVPIRIWTPGCASGEEAYSIAILLREAMDEMEAPLTAQVFATDIDEGALVVAREGRYPEAIADHVTAERLERFFVKKGRGFEVCKSVREMCVFSRHNLLEAPPFIRMDLISCRNVLIYLRESLQSRLIPIFHYALNSDGWLFLGLSESLGAHARLFRPLGKKGRIYQRTRAPIPSRVRFPVMGDSRPQAAREPRASEAETRRRAQRSIERTFLERHTPPSVVIDERSEVLFVTGRIGDFLELPAGPPDANLLRLARACLRSHLRAAVERTIKTKERVAVDLPRIETESGGRSARLVAEPFSDRKDGLFLIQFLELPDPNEPSDESMNAPDREAGVRLLESELRLTQERLEMAVRELETANEELMASNEELRSMNEELLLSNEELEISKEDVQSVNDELEKRLHELDNANSDLRNLFESTKVGAVFVDRDLRIKNFTPAISDVFGFRAEDLGRPLTDFEPRIAHPSLMEDAKDSLRREEVRSAEIWMAETGAAHMVRIFPYRDVSGAVNGLVITFVDVSEIKRAEAQSARLAAIVTSSSDAIIGMDSEGRIDTWNRAAERMYEYRESEMRGRPFSALAPREETAATESMIQAVSSRKALGPIETVRMAKSGKALQIETTLSVIEDGDGNRIGISAIEHDITERKRSEAALAAARAEIESYTRELEKRVEQRTQSLAESNQSLEGFCYSIAHDLRAPLRALQGITMALREDYREALDEVGRDYTERIVNAADRMDRLIQDLLAFGRLSHGDLATHPVHLDRVMREVLSGLESEIERTGAEISVDAPLPVMLGNPTLLGQVISNLLSNALKFMPPGQAPRIRVWSEDLGENARVFVEDNGLGIEPAHQQRVFHVFERLHASDEYPGTGIGLAIVAKGIQRLGGAVGLKSAPGQGSCFWFDLPKSNEVDEVDP